MANVFCLQQFLLDRRPAVSTIPPHPLILQRVWIKLHASLISFISALVQATNTHPRWRRAGGVRRIVQHLPLR